MLLAVDLSLLGSLHFIFYLILGLAVLAGLMRGFKKTLYTFIVMAIFYVVFFVTIDSIVAWLWTMDLSFLEPTLAGIDPALSGFTSFEDSINQFAQWALGDAVNLSATSDAVMALAVGLGQFVLKLVWTILYFTVILLVWKILTWIIGAIFVRNKEKASKNRGLGAVMGVANGLMAVFIMMIMLGGIMSVAESALVLLQDTSPTTMSFDRRNTSWDGSVDLIPLAETTMPDVSAYIDDLQAMVDEYNSDIFVSVANSITAPSVINPDVEVPLAINLFDKVLSFDYEGNTIGIRYELSVFSEAANVILQSDYMTTKEFTDITGDDIRDVFSYLSESTLITSLVPVAIEVGAQMYDETLTIDTDALYSYQWDQELANLGSIAGALFDILNGAGFIGGEGSVDQIVIDEDTVLELFGDMADSDVIVMLTESLLLPMLSNSDGQFSAILVVPDDLNVENEIRALGDIFAEIVSADIDFASFSDQDVTAMLSAVGQIDLTVLMESQLVTEALINILSGEAGIEGLDMLVVPDDLEWYDSGSGASLVPGELRNILTSLNVLADVAGDLDFNNLDVSALVDMTPTQIDDLLGSAVISATIGSTIYNLGTGALVIPDSVVETIQVNSANVNVIVNTEINKIIQALGAIDFPDFDNMTFDAGLLSSLENDTQDGLDHVKLATVLDSAIIQATVSDMVIGLEDNSGLLTIPENAANGDPVKTYDSEDDLYLVSDTEIIALMDALYEIGIDNFNAIDFEDTSLLFDHLDTFLESAVIHATISDFIMGMDGTITIPERSFDNNPVIIVQGATTYIDGDEITMLVDALDLLDVFNPTSFTTGFDLSMLDTQAKQDVVMDSAIMHATISDTLLGLDSSILYIPDTQQDGITDLKIARGVTDITTYVLPAEISALINVFNALSLDLTDLTLTFTTTDLLDNSALIVESSALQAQISDRILSGSGNIIIPDENLSALPLKIVQTDVSYIRKAELGRFLNAVSLLSVDDFATFDMNPSDIFSTDLDEFFNSLIMQATVSKYILDNSDDENPGSYGTTVLLVPTDQRELFDVDTVPTEQIIKSELILIIEALSTLQMDNFTDNMSPGDITGLDKTQIDSILDSVSFHVTIDNMLRDNANIVADIPTQAEVSGGAHGVNPLTTAEELSDFIFAIKTLGGTDFQTANVNAADFASLDDGQRITVLTSMIIRNKITPQLEVLDLADPLYTIEASDYVDGNTALFLTETGAKDAIDYFFTYTG
ncbi:MAG: hypothetical protein JXB08_03025 [Bacilli bacterium]|nr:hypothetical protein [Bacilli bacterium]MBN2876058.1 hypothetical protein [Bacilli bacterium]